MLVACAQAWAALRTWVCHCPASLGFLLNVANRLLATPPRSVPSGMKLSVMTEGLGQALPLADDRARRGSRGSRRTWAFHRELDRDRGRPGTRGDVPCTSNQRENDLRRVRWSAIEIPPRE